MMSGVIKGFREAVSGGTNAEVTAITGTLKQLNESLSMTQADLQRVGKTIEGSVVAGIHGAMTQLAQNIGTLNGQLVESVTSASGSLTSRLDAAAMRASDSFTSAASRLDGLLQQANGTVVSGGDTIQGTERVLERFGHIVAKLEESQLAFGKATEPIQLATGRLEGAAESLRKAAESIAHSSLQSHEVEDRVGKSWTQCAERFESVDKDLSRVFDNLNQGLVSYASTVNDFNGRLTKEFTTAIISLQGIVGDLDETLLEIRSESAKQKQ
jgi:hypothetical protein